MLQVRGLRLRNALHVDIKMYSSLCFFLLAVLVFFFSHSLNQIRMKTKKVSGQYICEALRLVHGLQLKSNPIDVSLELFVRGVAARAISVMPKTICSALMLLN